MANNTDRGRRRGARLVGFIIFQFFKWIFILIMTVVLLGAVTAYFALGYAKSYVEDVIVPQAEEAQASLNVAAYDPSLSTVIYYTDPATGQPVEWETLYAQENRKWVTYDELPEDLINVTVAIEDKRFWEHDGVDWRRTLGAVYYMFTGANVQGGSTITQQVIKNISQRDEVTVKRKVLEIFTALEFDKRHTKEETLELYFNYIYLGRQCNGVYTAANKYFAKDVSELDLAECACLISVTNNPSLYDPFTKTENNRRRAATAIQQMYKQEMISEQREIDTLAELGYLPTGEVDEEGNALYSYHPEADRIVIQDGSLSATVSTNTGDIRSYYADAVIAQVQSDLMEQYGYDKSTASDVIFKGGLSIYTCYDPNVQAIVDEVYSDAAWFAQFKSATGETLMSSISVTDNATGRVVAIGQNKEKSVNRAWVPAVDGYRPPGSSIKPLSVYAPAIEAGLITPYSAVDDTPVELRDDGTAWPRNASGSYSGLTTIYNGVLRSLNTCAVKTIDQIGVQNAYDFLENKFGISTLVAYREGSNGKIYSDLSESPLALGGLTDGITTFEMSGAYSVFARNGIYIKPHLYTLVTDSDGNEVLRMDEDGQRVLGEDTVYYMNRLLTGVVERGTGTKAQLDGITAAGKTGTTTNSYDRWFCGYTGYYTAAVWIGYDKMEKINASGNPAITLWKDVMSQLVEGKPDIDLTDTDLDIVTATYCTKSGKLATHACSQAGCAAKGYYVAGDAPSEYCDRHVTITVCKDDPIGETGMFRQAGEYCPEESRQELVVLDYARDEAAASVTAADSYQLLSWLRAQGKCTLHTEEWAAKVLLWSVQTISAPGSINAKVGDSAFNLGAVSLDGEGNPAGALSYSSSNPAVASVDSEGNVTIGTEGTAIITINAEATEYAEPVTATVTVTVTEPGSTLGEIIDNIIGNITGDGEEPTAPPPPPEG
ncbi:MAG: transglycosylase domain-containing protein [Oscillospiraceae bacterium]|nr:transglycosylase domain-containing protein [Oscillospiraceae bacterium]